VTSQANAAQVNTEYHRRDQEIGITAPDLSKACTFAEHIVRARGKRTAFTSVSLDPNSIRRFGPRCYLLLRDVLTADRHELVEHATLMADLSREVREEEKAARLLALRALQYAKMRKEGLVRWTFDISRIERKDLIVWAIQHVQRYFKKC